MQEYSLKSEIVISKSLDKPKTIHVSKASDLNKIVHNGRSPKIIIYN